MSEPWEKLDVKTGMPELPPSLVARGPDPTWAPSSWAEGQLPGLNASLVWMSPWCCETASQEAWNTILDSVLKPKDYVRFPTTKFFSLKHLYELNQWGNNCQTCLIRIKSWVARFYFILNFLMLLILLDEASHCPNPVPWPPSESAEQLFLDPGKPRSVSR